MAHVTEITVKDANNASRDVATLDALAGNLTTVTLSLDTSAYASGDLLADTQVITGAFLINDGKGFLNSILLVDEDDQGAALDIYFLDANVSLGSENSAPSVTDANARNILCRVQVSTGDYTDLGGVKIADLSGLNRFVKAASGSADLYVAVVNGTGTPTYTASGIRLRVGIL